MAAMGYCPSGRLFEAAACGAALLTDAWEGLECFFTPGEEILVAERTQDVVDALSWSDEALLRIGLRARERALDEHTIDHRARELVSALERASASRPHRPSGFTSNLEA